MQMPCWPARSPRRRSNRLPGGTASSRSSRTRLSCVSLRRTVGQSAAGQAALARRLSTPLNRSSVAASANDRITTCIITAYGQQDCLPSMRRRASPREAHWYSLKSRRKHRFPRMTCSPPGSTRVARWSAAPDRAQLPGRGRGRGGRSPRGAGSEGGERQIGRPRNAVSCDGCTGRRSTSERDPPWPME